ncbi:hypothetical protein [Sabulibacter ruber]|uniref:hypothetical protein n=1 Tax=Sabulibacter ruber TaxID=2811901 RepID=UPI001A95B569|nr:hypothetical protein [Sabulibacter ruber]
MKKVLLALLLLGAMSSYEAAAQESSAKPMKVKLGKSVVTVHPEAQYYVKLEDRTLELESLALEQFDANWIASAEALKPAEAQENFGEKGEFGAVLITLNKKYEAEALQLMQDLKRRKL